MQRCIQFLIISCVCCTLGFSQNPSVSGLEYGSHVVNVVVEDVSKDALAAGITKGALQTRCESRLRQMGANPDSDSAALPYLYLNVNIGKTETNYLFTASLEFKRLVAFDHSGLLTGKGETYAMHATTWKRSTLGDFEGGGEFVMKTVDGFLDEFAKSFVKANPGFKGKKRR